MDDNWTLKTRVGVTRATGGQAMMTCAIWGEWKSGGPDGVDQCQAAAQSAPGLAGWAGDGARVGGQCQSCQAQAALSNSRQSSPEGVKGWRAEQGEKEDEQDPQLGRDGWSDGARQTSPQRCPVSRKTCQRWGRAAMQ